MQAEISPNAQEPANRTEKLKEKKDYFTWWQATIILVATAIVCLSAGYFISEKFLWHQNDQLTKMLKYDQQQVNAKPNDPNLRVQLGYAEYLKGNDSEAINQFNTAIGLDKNNYGAYLNLAIVYDKENQTDQALQSALKASKLVQNDYKSELLIGRSYRKLKMYKQAMAALQIADQYKPDNDDVTFEAGMVAEDQGQTAQALQIFKEVLSYDPTYKPAIDEISKLQGKK